MKKIFAANWKMYKTPDEARHYFAEFLAGVKSIPHSQDKEVVFFPATICLEAVSKALAGSAIQWGVQNAYIKNEGAFTGETSMQTVRTLGGQFVLIGHSERRSLFFENDEMVALKTAQAQEMGLRPLLCIGESLSEREAGVTQDVLRRQLTMGLAKTQPGKDLVVAYEPVWAIGTGKVASPAQVAEAHTWVQQILVELGFAQTPILYGGSVKPENAAELLAQNFVGGFLVGGASLEPASFLKICSVG